MTLTTWVAVGGCRCVDTRQHVQAGPTTSGMADQSMSLAQLLAERHLVIPPYRRHEGERQTSRGMSIARTLKCACHCASAPSVKRSEARFSCSHPHSSVHVVYVRKSMAAALRTPSPVFLYTVVSEAAQRPTLDIGTSPSGSPSSIVNGNACHRRGWVRPVEEAAALPLSGTSPSFPPVGRRMNSFRSSERRAFSSRQRR